MQRLKDILGADNVSTEPEELERFSTDALTPSRAFHASPLLGRRPDVVVTPHSTEEVTHIVKLACKYRVPLVPYGGGTGVMGGAVPVQGGIVVNLGGMNHLLKINREGRTTTVEGGMILEDLEKALNQHGLMLGHDPWSLPIATVAGAISTNGVGYRASQYGPMGDQVVALEVVLPDGRVLNTRPVPKYASGPNLNHLFIGSEGVLGIITKATLSVFPLPEERLFATFGFPSFDMGFQAVVGLFDLGLRPALVDLTEEEEGVKLYLMYEGFRESVEAQYRRSLSLCQESGGEDLGAKDTVEYWNTRYDIARRYQRQIQERPANRSGRNPGLGFDYLHVALPLSRVLEYKRQCQEILERRGISVREWALWTSPELFSMFLVPGDAQGSEADENMAAAVDEVLSLAQDMGGSMEYCHGVGIKLAHLMERELGVGLEVVRAIKLTLDPYNIMNPGKLGL